MKLLVKAERVKLKRIKMTYVGYISIILGAFVTCIQVLTVNNMAVTYVGFTDMYIYNNALLFYPFAIALIGGYMINQEYVLDTQKNFLVIPVSLGDVIKAKMAVLFLMGLRLSMVSSILAGIVCLALKCPDMTVLSFLANCLSFILAGFFICVGILPVILWSSKAKGGYIWGSIFAALLGITGVFVVNGKLGNWHPATYCFSIVSHNLVTKTGRGIAMSCIAFVMYSLLTLAVYRIIYKKERW